VRSSEEVTHVCKILRENESMYIFFLILQLFLILCGVRNKELCIIVKIQDIKAVSLFLSSPS
jgi:hypothetical protein